MEFSLLQYRALVAVVDAGSVRGAADLLHRSPSAISMILTQLEDRIGTRLFEGARKSELTEMGAFVLQEARALVDHDDRVARAIRSFAEGRLGRLDVACIPSVANVFLPEVLETIWSEGRSIALHVRDSDSRSVIEMVAEDSAEIGIAAAVGLTEELTFSPLFNDAMAVVCSAAHPLCDESKPLSWAALNAYRFIGNTSYTLVQSDELRRLVGRQAAYVPNITSLLALVRSGAGITLLPRINALHASAGLEFLPLGDAAATRCVGLVARQGRTLSPAARTFCATLTAVIARRAGEHDETGIDLI